MKNYFKKYTVILICIITFLFIQNISCKRKGKNNPEACNGKTRREVKLCTDEAALKIDTNAVLVTIDELGNLSVPDDVKSSTSRQAIEIKTFTVRAKVDKCRKEQDGDYHIRLVDDNGNYLITESANPNCDYAKTSRFFTQICNVRDFVKNNDVEGKTITITGVSFVDIDHKYKRKQAKNNIELHPILKISF